MKRWGFLTGVVFGALVVWAFNALTSVTDDGRLAAVLQDHCLPYVTTGAAPFQDLGRTPGVYDALRTEDDFENGGLRLIFDNRFIAKWGEATNETGPVRACIVTPNFGEGTQLAFSVSADGFIDRVTDLIRPFEPLAPNSDSMPEEPTVIGWYGVDRDGLDGLVVVLTVGKAEVMNILVSQKLT